MTNIQIIVFGTGGDRLIVSHFGYVTDGAFYVHFIGGHSCTFDVKG